MPTWFYVRYARAAAYAASIGALATQTQAQVQQAQASTSGATLDDTRGATVCAWRAYLDDRVPLVRRQTSRVRVQQPQAHVSLLGAHVRAGSDCCRVTRRQTGVHREMGYVELEIEVSARCAWRGDPRAALSVRHTHIPRGSRRTCVHRERIGRRTKSVRPPGRARARVVGAGCTSDFAIVERSDTECVLAPTSAFCTNEPRADYRAPFTQTGFCGVRLPYFAIERDRSCQSPVPPTAVAPPPRRSSGQTDLVAGYSGVPTRASGVKVVTYAGGAQQVPDSLCNGVSGESNNIITF